MSVILLLAAVPGSGVLAAGEARIDGDGILDSVVVFADRARVTRLGSAACEKGTAKVVFSHLPAPLDQRTLRGEAREAGDVIGLTSDLVNERQAVDPRARAIEDRQRRIEGDMRANEARRNVLAAEGEHLNAYAGVFGSTIAEDMRNPRPTTASWGKTLDTFRARRASLAEERRKLDVALRALRLDASKAERELQHLGGAGARAYRTASVMVTCRGSSRVTAALSYVVPGATWRPEYDLDFSPRGREKSGAGTARLTVGAVVRQATGEDWNAARLSLSTARPKLGAEAPLPAPLVVDGHEEQVDKVLVQAQERRDQLRGGGGPGAVGPSAAGLDDKGTAFVLNLPNRVSIPADGRPVWAPIDVMDAPATVKLVATPKLDEHVYQVVSMKNPAAYALIEGRMRGYRAGSYIGEAAFAYRGVGEPLEVSLGIDDEIKVERKTVDERDRNAAFLGSTKHILRAYRVTISNRADSAETVELRENIPVSEIDDVKVELVAKQTTKGFALDSRRGLVTWAVPLKSGEWRNIDLGYAIHLPESWQVNRRP